MSRRRPKREPRNDGELVELIIMLGLFVGVAWLIYQAAPQS